MAEKWEQTRSDRDYMSGHCHLLAAAVQQATGWPAWLLENEWDESHVVVGTPDGRWLDAEGLHTAGDLDERWGCYPRPIGHVAALDWPGVPAEQDHAEARRLLARVGTGQEG